MARVALDTTIRLVAGQAQSGTRLYIYHRGTNTPVTGYTTEAGGTTVTYPLLSDSEGRFPAAWYAPGSYDLYSPDDALNPTQPWEAALGNLLAAGTVLPTAPTDGQFFIYNANITDGVKWMFQYRSASASTYKWEFIGGPPLVGEVDALESTTSISLVDLTTVGPSVTVPLAGDYFVSYGANLDNNSASGYSMMSFAVGATAASFDDIVENEAGAASKLYSLSRQRKKTVATASSALVCKYAVAVATTGRFRWRFINATPIRVTG